MRRSQSVRCSAPNELFVQFCHAIIPLCVTLTARNDLDALREALRNMVRVPKGGTAVGIPGYKHRWYGRAHWYAIFRRERSLRPILTGGLLLADTVVAQERVLGFPHNGCFPQECDVLVACDGEKQTEIQSGVRVTCVRHNAFRNGVPVSNIGLMNQPRKYCGTTWTIQP